MGRGRPKVMVVARCRRTKVMIFWLCIGCKVEVFRIAKTTKVINIGFWSYVPGNATISNKAKITKIANLINSSFR